MGIFKRQVYSIVVENLADLRSRNATETEALRRNQRMAQAEFVSQMTTKGRMCIERNDSYLEINKLDIKKTHLQHTSVFNKQTQSDSQFNAIYPT